MPPAFEFPFFFNYPPYFTCAQCSSCLSSCTLLYGSFTLSHQALSKADSSLCRLQPVKETRQKQISLWTELILKYCKHHKVSCRAS